MIGHAKFVRKISLFRFCRCGELGAGRHFAGKLAPIFGKRLKLLLNFINKIYLLARIYMLVMSINQACVLGPAQTWEKNERNEK